MALLEATWGWFYVGILAAACPPHTPGWLIAQCGSLISSRLRIFSAVQRCKYTQQGQLET